MASGSQLVEIPVTDLNHCKYVDMSVAEVEGRPFSRVSIVKIVLDERLEVVNVGEISM